jgi:PRTRC genetic system protein A
MIRIGDLLQHHIYQGELPPANPHGYQYIMAGNGILLRAQNRWLDVAQLVNRAEVRGLPVLRPFVRLHHAKLPGRFLLNIILHAQKHLEREVVYQVVEENGRLRLRVVAYGTRTSATFEDCVPSDQIVFEAHSHNTMKAFFSGTDNAYEQHFRWYAVVGELDKQRPSVVFRLGVYGYHFTLPLESLFDLSDVQHTFQFDTSGAQHTFKEVIHAY